MTPLAAEKPKLGFLISIALIYLFAIYIQHQLFLNWDVSTLLLETQKLLNGGNYVDDFFTPNPPMIMYLYTIPVVLAKLSHLSFIYIFPFYIFLLATISFVISYQLTTTIFLTQDRLQAYVFMCAILVIFLIVPLYELGQRDHLLVVMTMPYLLITTCRLENKPIDKKLAVFIGLFASTAIAFKPQFLVLPLLIESYYLFTKRNWLACIKPETIAMLAWLITYVIIVSMTHPEYFKIIIPYLLQNYYHSADHRTLILYGGMINYCYAALCLHIVLNKLNKYKQLGTILALALVAFILTFVTQLFSQFYHQVPSISLAILLSVQLYVNIAAQQHISWPKYKLILLATAGLIAYIYYFWSGIAYSLYFYPITILSFFTIFLFILLMILKPAQAMLTRIATLAYIIAMGYLSSLIGVNIYFVHLQLFLTILVILLLFSLKTATALPKRASNFLIAILGIAIFSIPFIAEQRNFDFTQRFYKKLILNNLIAFMHTQPPHTSIYSFSIGTGFSFPLNYYTGAVVKQRFEALWMLTNVIDQIQSNGDSELIDNIKNNKSKYYFVNMITSDLKTGQPDLIFIEDKFDGISKYLGFDYLHYFLQNEAFSQVWKNYQYLTTLETPELYKLSVYKRIDTLQGAQKKNDGKKPNKMDWSS
jgi:hypothetical protein